MRCKQYQMSQDLIPPPPSETAAYISMRPFFFEPLSWRLPRSPWIHRRTVTSFGNSCDQVSSRFVVASLLGGERVFGGDEFASEGFAEERLREAVDVRLSLRQPGLDLVREREQLFDATHDFLLLGQWGKRDDDVANVVEVQARFALSIRRFEQLLSAVCDADNPVK